MGKIKKILAILLFIFFLTVVIVSQIGILDRTENKDLWVDISPGKTTKDEIIGKFGDPVGGSGNNLEFKSASPNRKHSVNFNEEDTATFIKEIITDNKTVSTIENVYGEPQYVLHGEETSLGYQLFVYPDKGIAYLGNRHSGDLLEIWHFPSTTYESFKETYAQGFSETVTQPQQ